jgi:hypothetical protein
VTAVFHTDKPIVAERADGASIVLSIPEIEGIVGGQAGATVEADRTPRSCSPGPRQSLSSSRPTCSPERASGMGDLDVGTAEQVERGGRNGLLARDGKRAGLTGLQAVLGRRIGYVGVFTVTIELAGSG